jgi:hypothetical protein
MSDLNKYFRSETIELMRTEITPAPYNPRVIEESHRKSLKRSVKAFGIVGGMVWNATTSNLVSGHQKLSILDELSKYDPKNKETDYKLKVEKIEVDVKTEKELNIFFNNPNSQGTWDYDALREMIPDIDYKDAGLTDEDLSLIGIDFEFQTEDEIDLAGELEAMTMPVQEQKEAKKAAVKEMKAKIKEDAEEKIQHMESYIMLNFKTYEAKTNFMRKFGYDDADKFIKGEHLTELIDNLS